eukprot:5981495-Pleurochrysis_carterae.AAC.1
MQYLWIPKSQQWVITETSESTADLAPALASDLNLQRAPKFHFTPAPRLRLLRARSLPSTQG